jgi:hypothetical protein
MSSEHIKDLLSRVRLDGYYTDGERMVEIDRTEIEGKVYLIDSLTGYRSSVGIWDFRKRYWLIQVQGREKETAA